MNCVCVPGLVSGCICSITRGFKAANHAAMPHRKASLLSCALCLNKHLSKHLDNHFGPHLNTHTYTITHIYYTHLAFSATHGVDLVSDRCPTLWSSRCPKWLENRENYGVNIPTWFIRRQRAVVRKWSTVLSNPFSINLPLSLNSSPPFSSSHSVLLGSNLLTSLQLFMLVLFITGIYEFVFGVTLWSMLPSLFSKRLVQNCQ